MQSVQSGEGDLVVERNTGGRLAARRLDEAAGAHTGACRSAVRVLLHAAAVLHVDHQRLMSSFLARVRLQHQCY